MFTRFYDPSFSMGTLLLLLLLLIYACIATDLIFSDCEENIILTCVKGVVVILLGGGVYHIYNHNWGPFAHQRMKTEMEQKNFEADMKMKEAETRLEREKFRLERDTMKVACYYCDMRGHSGADCTVKKLSLSGVLTGHNKSITALTLSADRQIAFTADFEGHITRWNVADGKSERLTSAIHKSQVSGLALTGEGVLVSTGWDDSVAFTDGAKTASENVKPTAHKLASQPRGVASTASGDKVAVACQRAIVLFSGKQQLNSTDIKYEGTCVAIHPDGKLLAVGGNDARVHVYDLAGNCSLSEKKTLQHAGAVSSVSFSPNGKHLVATDISHIVSYSVSDDFEVASEKDWSFHTACINCSAWSANSRYVATGTDSSIMVWDLGQSGDLPCAIRIEPHSMSAINGVVWLSDNRLLSAGQDSDLRQWTLRLN